VTIVGFGTIETKEKEKYKKCSGYWIVRPPLGKTFGDDGHIRLCIPPKKSELDSTDNEKEKITVFAEEDKTGTCKVQTIVQWPEIGKKRK